MKSTIAMVLGAVVCVSLLAVDYLQYRHSNEVIEVQRQQITALEKHVETLTHQLDATEAKVNALRETSLGGVIDNANTALIEGWAAMMEAVEQQLQRAREEIEKDRQRGAPAEELPGGGEG